VYDRSLSRPYRIDPILYNELLKARQRLAVQFERQLDRQRYSPASL
jgi:hypothetical protein